MDTKDDQALVPAGCVATRCRRIRRNFLVAARTHWRSGTGGAANILDSDATAVRDLIAFLRTIDDRTTPFPASDLAPNDTAFADATALCECQQDPPLGTPALDCTP